jgi:hypothetical protein
VHLGYDLNDGIEIGGGREQLKGFRGGGVIIFGAHVTFVWNWPAGGID